MPSVFLLFAALALPVPGPGRGLEEVKLPETHPC